MKLTDCDKSTSHMTHNVTLHLISLLYNAMIQVCTSECLWVYSQSYDKLKIKNGKNKNKIFIGIGMECCCTSHCNIKIEGCRLNVT